ncbi:MAG TPA: aminoacyl-histidine dipeptidase [Chitinophagaceae bacterium]|nr:aminoacyl-histidine dipeptidase [Chitinophagaceae bacterium]
MNQEIRNLTPKNVWSNFCDLNAVPRPSKKEEKVVAFIKQFGESLQLKTIVDEVGNVIIKKPASKGMEARLPIVLQSHLDMVHQKNKDTDFDFLTQGIEMKVEGDWVKAKGTTLGADNGIGVSAIMAILASNDIAHPPIEALFTIDEETGMTGAFALKGGLLNGKILLNLDTEEDNELTIGCAGGIDVTANGNYATSSTKSSIFFQIKLSGLTGGHSGIDIHKGRANVNKLMNRLLWDISKNIHFELASIHGGSLRNAIPRESIAVIGIQSADESILKKSINEYQHIFKQEYKTTDPNLDLHLTTIEKVETVADIEFVKQFLNAVYSCHNGIYRMSPDIDSLVQTSNNIARIELENGLYSVQCLTRSSVQSEKIDLANSIKASFEQIGASVTFKGDYPGWIPNPHAAIVTIMSELYEKMHHSKAHVNACHAGLECGILGQNYPDMQMISFGPNIYGAHSPDERVQISSVQKFWAFLLETLKQIPEKG